MTSQPCFFPLGVHLTLVHAVNCALGTYTHNQGYGEQPYTRIGLSLFLFLGELLCFGNNRSKNNHEQSPRHHRGPSLSQDQSVAWPNRSPVADPRGAESEACGSRLETGRGCPSLPLRVAAGSSGRQKSEKVLSKGTRLSFSAVSLVSLHHLSRECAHGSYCPCTHSTIPWFSLACAYLVMNGPHSHRKAAVGMTVSLQLCACGMHNILAQ